MWDTRTNREHVGIGYTEAERGINDFVLNSKTPAEIVICNHSGALVNHASTSDIQYEDTGAILSNTTIPTVRKVSDEQEPRKLSNGEITTKLSDEKITKNVLRTPITRRLSNQQAKDRLRAELCKQNGEDILSTIRETDKLQIREFRKWFVLVAGFVNDVLVAGFVFHLSIFYVEWLREFGQSNSRTALVQSACVGSYMIGGFVAGLLIAKYGPSKCGMFGGMIATLGLVMAYFAPSIIYLSLCVAISGVGGSLVFISAATGVGMYFIGRIKILALAFITFGAGVGMMVFPIIAEILMTKFGWRGTLLIEAGLMLNSVPNSSFFTVPADLKTNTNLKDGNKSSSSVVDNEDQQSISIISLHSDITTGSSVTNNQCHHENNEKGVLIILKRLFVDKVFVIYALTLAISVASCNFVLIFIIDYFRSKNIARTDAVKIYMYMTIANTSFRLLSGCFKQIPHVSALIIPAFGTLCGSISTTTFLLVGSSYDLNVIVAFVFGCGFGCIISALVATTGKLISQEAYSVGFGTSFTIMGIMVLIGGPVSGYIRDTTGNYDVLFFSVSVILLLSSISFFMTMVYRHCSKRAEQSKE